MSTDKNIHFKELNETEKNSKLFQLVNGKNSNNELTVWEKGSTKKYKLETQSFTKIRQEVSIRGDFPDDLISKKLLATFELNGVHFFGEVSAVKHPKSFLAFAFSHKLFKSERRNNFRLLTFPHHQVYVHIFIGKKEIEKSNVIELNTKQSQTKLFKNFLDIMGEKDEEILENLEGYLKFRVIDVSVTGLGFQFGKLEQEFFQKVPTDLESIFLDFNGKFIKIPESKILYIIEKVGATKDKAQLFKAGVEFQNIDTNLDVELGKIINQTLRSAESEFEDFIK